MARNKQVAALPWRKTDNGVEILLVTTRTTKRWVIPKGWPMKERADHDAAAQEAFEEAGVRGQISTLPLGRFGYIKILESGKPRHVTASVYDLHVQQVLDTWPEQHERQRRWAPRQDALDLIGEPELLRMVVAFFENPPVTRTRGQSSFYGELWKKLLQWLRKFKT